MIHPRRAVSTSLILGSLIGCGAMVQSGGFEVYKDTYDQGVQSVVSQSSFSTSCPAAQVKVVVLAVSPGDSSLPTSMGADACGKKLIYQRVLGNWVLNSSNSGERASEK